MNTISRTFMKTGRLSNVMSMRWASCGIDGIEKITYVKKIKMDGTPCKKCGDVTERLEKADQLKLIDSVEIADERDDSSIGMAIAAKHSVERAPFFVVEKTDGNVCSSFYKFP